MTQQVVPITVELGVGASITAILKGEVNVDMEMTRATIKNVYYIPSIKWLYYHTENSMRTEYQQSLNSEPVFYCMGNIMKFSGHKKERARRIVYDKDNSKVIWRFLEVVGTSKR